MRLNESNSNLVIGGVFQLTDYNETILFLRIQAHLALSDLAPKVPFGFIQSYPQNPLYLSTESIAAVEFNKPFSLQGRPTAAMRDEAAVQTYSLF